MKAGTRELLRFSVIIPTYQRRDLVLASVRALEKQEFHEPFEVIVVVDGSTDGSPEALRTLDPHFPFTVLEQTNQGAAMARNHGADISRGEILLFLDDDMEADPKLLMEHSQSHSEGADLVFGHIPLYPNSPANFLSDGIKWWTDGRLKRLTTPGEKLTLHDLLTGQMSVSRETFFKTGKFDTNFTHGGTFGDEDVDFGYRMMKSGYKLVFNPNAISFQNYVVTPRHLLRQMRQAGHADVIFARKHPDQAKTIFQLNGSEERTTRLFWRPLASLSPWTIPVMGALRLLALKLSKRAFPRRKAIDFFYGIRALEYWRGVYEIGGMPRQRPLRILAYHAIKDLRSAPILESYGVPPSVFRDHLKILQKAGFRFITGDELLHFLSGTGGLPPRPLFLTFDDTYEDLITVVLPVLKEQKIPAVAFAVSKLLGRTNEWDQAIGAPTLQLLKADDLKALVSGGIEIGAHSRSHRDLTKVTEEELWQEVEGCVSDIETIGLAKPRLFSYPYGEWNLKVQHTLKAAGIQAAFTVERKRVLPGCNPYQIPRIEIMREDQGLMFLKKILLTR